MEKHSALNCKVAGNEIIQRQRRWEPLLHTVGGGSYRGAGGGWRYSQCPVEALVWTGHYIRDGRGEHTPLSSPCHLLRPSGPIAHYNIHCFISLELSLFFSSLFFKMKGCRCSERESHREHFQFSLIFLGKCAGIQFVQVQRKYICRIIVQMASTNGFVQEKHIFCTLYFVLDCECSFSKSFCRNYSRAITPLVCFLYIFCI